VLLSTYIPEVHNPGTVVGIENLMIIIASMKVESLEKPTLGIRRRWKGNIKRDFKEIGCENVRNMEMLRILFYGELCISGSEPTRSTKQ
jgi:hypothetical protein